MHYAWSTIGRRHRGYRACTELGIEPWVRPFDEKGDPLDYVISSNMVRRHLDESQRSMVSAKIANLKNGTKYQHQTSKVGSSIELPTQKPVSLKQAATMMNVSVPSVKRARAVLTNSSAALQRAVEDGDISVNAASEVAKMPASRQRELVASGPRAVVSKNLDRIYRQDAPIGAITQDEAAKRLNVGRHTIQRARLLRSPQRRHADAHVNLRAAFDFATTRCRDCTLEVHPEHVGLQVWPTP